MRFTVILADDEPPLLQEQFMIQLVKGSLTPEQVQRQQKNLSISLDANHFCVVSMKTTAENDDYLSQFSVTESVNEMLEQVCSFRTFRYLDKIFICCCFLYRQKCCGFRKRCMRHRIFPSTIIK